MVSPVSQTMQSQLRSTSSLGKPSIFSRNKPLNNLNIMIVDTDYRLAALMKNILFGLGCQTVTTLRDAPEAIAFLDENPIDIILTENRLKSMSGLQLAGRVRSSKNPEHRALPVILMSAQSDREHVTQARDAGINEYMLKPFCAKSLLERIYQLIEKPRGFVISTYYVGPDRRYMPQNDNQPQEKRSDGAPFIVRHPPRLIDKRALYNHVVSGAPCMVVPDYALKKKIGFFVTEETQMSLPPMQLPLDGIALLRQEVQELKDAYAMLQKNPQKPQLFLDHLQKTALSIARNARYSGHTRVAQVAVLLVDFYRHYFNAKTRQHIKILYTYIDALATLTTHDIKGDGGNIGESLYRNLRDLMQHYGNAA